MTTEIARIETTNFLALQDGGAIAEAMQANMGAEASLKESDLTRITIPAGGGTSWMIPTLLGDETTKSLEGVLVWQCVRGLLWPSHSPTEGTLPVLCSHDLKVGNLVCDQENVPKDVWDSIQIARRDDGLFDWDKLPQTQWGSGTGGTGKAVKEQRVLFILREQDALPCVVTISPGSLKEWSKFMIEMTKAGIPFYRAVVSLSLEKDKATSGESFSRVVPKLAGVLSSEDGEVIREKFSAPMREVALSSFSG